MKTQNYFRAGREVVNAYIIKLQSISSSEIYKLIYLARNLKFRYRFNNIAPSVIVIYYDLTNCKMSREQEMRGKI